jgi:hypothetical protein
MRRNTVEMPATEPALAFDERDAVLALALGSLSFVQRLEEQVRVATADAVRPHEVDDPVVLAALGAISAGRTLKRWLAEAREAGSEIDDVSPSGSLMLPRDVLR